MYSPNAEYRIKKEGPGQYRLYYLEPTNIVDMGWGARGGGGKVTDLGVMDASQIYKTAGDSVGNLYPILAGGVEAYQAAGTPDFQGEISKTFSSNDPNNLTGWKEKLPELTQQAKTLFTQDPSQLDKVYGTVWNQWRYSPSNAQSIGKVQSANGTSNVSQGTPEQQRQKLNELIGQGVSPQDAYSQVYKQTQPSQVGQNEQVPQVGQTQPVQQDVQGEVESKVLDTVQKNLESGIINPDVEIDASLIAGYLKQAKEELSPYYAELQRQGKEDISTAFRQLGEDIISSERKLGYEYGQNLRNIQESAARRGLTFSTIRTGQEQDLASRTQAAIEEGRKQAERRALQLGTTAERELGTSNLPELMGMKETPRPIVGKPGQFGFEQVGGARSLFAPVGGIVGKLPTEQLASEEARKRELIKGEREYRGLQTI